VSSLVRVGLGFVEAYLQQRDRIALFPDVEDALIRIKERGMQIGIVSSTPRIILDTVLAKYGAKRLFDTVLALEDCREFKPSPQPILEAVTRLGVPKQDIAYVGDMDEDVQAANAA